MGNMRRLDARSGVRDESFIAPPVLKQDAEKRRRHTIGAPAASPSLGGFHVRPLVETKLALGLRAQSVDRLEFAGGAGGEDAGDPLAGMPSGGSLKEGSFSVCTSLCHGVSVHQFVHQSQCTAMEKGGLQWSWRGGIRFKSG